MEAHLLAVGVGGVSVTASVAAACQRVDKTILILVALNLVLVLRVTVKQNDRGEHEVTLSVKGKAGKGWYGAPRGLQILDQ